MIGTLPPTLCREPCRELRRTLSRTEATVKNLPGSAARYRAIRQGSRQSSRQRGELPRPAISCHHAVGRCPLLYSYSYSKRRQSLPMNGRPSPTPRPLGPPGCSLLGQRGGLFTVHSSQPNPTRPAPPPTGLAGRRFRIGSSLGGWGQPPSSAMDAHNPRVSRKAAVAAPSKRASPI